MLLYISVQHEFINARLLSGDFPGHAKISRAGTTIAINVIVVLPRDILAFFGNLPESNRAFYEFMIYRNEQ